MKDLYKRFPVYSTLLKLYPPAYRRQFEQAILQTTADMLDDPENSRLSTWLRTTVDFPINVTKQNLISAGGIMAQETPNYVKRNSLISSILIAPFFVFIAFNSLTNHTVIISAGWKTAILILILGLPALATLIGIGTFLNWSVERSRKKQVSFWSSIFDIKHNWPVLVTTGLALMIVLLIPFHDSTKCVNGNPLRELKHLHETWQCIQQRG